mgnify:CR=1 FL=1
MNEEKKIFIGSLITLIISTFFACIFVLIEIDILIAIFAFLSIGSLITFIILLLKELSKKQSKKDKIIKEKVISNNYQYQSKIKEKNIKNKQKNKFEFKNENDRLYEEAVKFYGKNKVKYRNKQSVIEDYLLEDKTFYKKD